jgi:hypothetical protein
VPHALRVVAAELPRLLGQPARTVDALYELADRCAREAAAAAAAGGGEVSGSGSCGGGGGGSGGVSASASAVAEGLAGRVKKLDVSAAEAVAGGGAADFGVGTAGTGTVAVRVWRRRRDAALHAAVNLHAAGKDYAAALARLDWMARCRPAPVGLYKFNPVDPYLENRLVTQPLNLSSDFLVSSLCFQMQPVPLRPGPHPAVPRRPRAPPARRPRGRTAVVGAVQVEFVR